MLSIFVSAFILGLIFSMAPGPIFAESLRQGINGGFRPALSVQLGSLVGDATWAILGLLGIGMLLQLEILRLPLGVLGASYLLYLSWSSWRSADQKIELQPSVSADALRSGIFLSLTNPQNIAYWAAIGSALGALGVENPSFIHYLIYFSGFMLSSFFWCFICASAIHILVRRFDSGWSRLTYKICAIVFLLIALASFRDLLFSQANLTVSPKVMSQNVNYNFSE